MAKSNRDTLKSSNAFLKLTLLKYQVVQMLRRKPHSVTLKMQSGEALSLSSIASRNHINISTEQIPLTFRNIEKMKQSEKDAPVRYFSCHYVF